MADIAVKQKRVRLRFSEQSADVLKVTSRARALSDRAIVSLAWVKENSPDHKARVLAAGMILERAWGKIPQTITAQGNSQSPVKVEVVYRKRDDDKPSALIDITPEIDSTSSMHSQE